MTRRRTPAYLFYASQAGVSATLFHQFLILQLGPEFSRNSRLRADALPADRAGGLRRRLWQVQPRLDVTSLSRAGPTRTSSLNPYRSHGNRAARKIHLLEAKVV